MSTYVFGAVKDLKFPTKSVFTYFPFVSDCLWFYSMILIWCGSLFLCITKASTPSQKISYNLSSSSSSSHLSFYTSPGLHTLKCFCITFTSSSAFTTTQCKIIKRRCQSPYEVKLDSIWKLRGRQKEFEVSNKNFGILFLNWLTRM